MERHTAQVPFTTRTEGTGEGQPKTQREGQGQKAGGLKRTVKGECQTARTHDPFLFFLVAFTWPHVAPRP